MSKQEFQINNQRLIEKLQEKYPNVDTFDGWKHRGRFVKRGEKSELFEMNAQLQVSPFIHQKM